MDLSIPVQVNPKDVTAEIIDRELIAVNWETGTYYNVEGVGVEIWDYIDKGATAGFIVDAITARYAGDAEEIKWAVLRLLLQMREEQLVVFGEPDSAEVAESDSVADQTSEVTDKEPFVPVELQKYDDMSDLLTIDPIHETDDAGWPAYTPED